MVLKILKIKLRKILVYKGHPNGPIARAVAQSIVCSSLNMTALYQWESMFWTDIESKFRLRHAVT